jgi:hypothetical protein
MFFIMTTAFFTMVVVAIVSEFVRSQYPSMHKELLLSICYDLLKKYSRVELQLKKWKRQWSEKYPAVVAWGRFIYRYWQGTENLLNHVLFVKDGRIVQTSKRILAPLTGAETPVDFILVTDEVEENVLLRRMLTSVDEMYKREAKPSANKFMLFEVILDNDIAVKVDLAQPNYSYYVQGNKIHMPFIQYIMMHYYENQYNQGNRIIKEARILDNCVQWTVLKEGDELVLV